MFYRASVDVYVIFKSSSIYCSKVNYYNTAVCDVIVRRVHTVQLIDNKNVWCELRTWSRSSTGTR